MRKTISTAACLLVLCAAAEAGAQTPAQTPRPPIRIGRPAGGAGAGTSTGAGTTGSTGGTSTGSTPGQKGPADGQRGTLVCRMGGSMTWTLVNQFGVVETQLGGQSARVPVVLALFEQLRFARGKAPAQVDASNLEPGTCSFRDRAMTSADPDTVTSDADGFTLNETVQYGNGSTLGGETTMAGGALNFQNKQAFSMQVTLWGGVQWKVVAGTKPKAIK